MLTRLEPRSRNLLTLLICNFAAFGIIFTVVGAALPQIIRTYHWSYALTGLVLSASAIGYFLSCFFSGLLVRPFPPKTVLVAGLVVGAAGMSLFARWPSPLLNFCLNLAVGLCQGATEVVTNMEVVQIEQKGQSRIMNLVHAAFCVGAMVGPAMVGYLAVSGISGTVMFSVSAGVLLLMAILFAVTVFPRPHQEASDPAEDGGWTWFLRQPMLLLLSFLLLVYVGAELGVSTWVSEYFVTVLGASESTGALMVSVLWFGLLVGRLSTSLGYRGTHQEYLLLGFALLAAAGVGDLLAARSQVGVGIGVLLAGLGLSAIYPTAMAVVGHYYPSGAAVGTAASGGGFGSFAFPFLMSVLSQEVGLRGGFWFYLGLTLVIALLSSILIRMVRRRT